MVVVVVAARFNLTGSSNVSRFFLFPASASDMLVAVVVVAVVVVVVVVDVVVSTLVPSPLTAPITEVLTNPLLTAVAELANKRSN